MTLFCQQPQLEPDYDRIERDITSTIWQQYDLQSSKMKLNISFSVIYLVAIKSVSTVGPFFLELSTTEHVIGNGIWNITIGPTYGTKLFYKNKEIVGDAQGHYLSYSKVVSVT